MADSVLDQVTVNSTSIPGDKTVGVSYPKDYTLITIDLIGGNGTFLDLKPLMVELSYFEDLYNNFVTGQLLITDALGIIARMSLHGNEYIRVTFDKGTTKSQYTVDKLFRIYKIAKRQKTFNIDSEVYVLNFCSDEVLLSEQTKISKSYPRQTIRQIVVDILENYLKVPSTRYSLDETLGSYNFIIPNLKPFEAINWLCTYAKSGETSGGSSYNVGADLLFYQDKNNYNLTSLQTLFNKSVATSSNFYYDPKNVGASLYTGNRDIFNVLSYEFLDSFDSIEGVSTGMFANRVLTFDPLLRRYSVNDFNYETYTGVAKTLNKNPIVNNTVNRIGKALYETPDACYKLAVSNKNQRVDVKYINETFEKQNSVSPDIDVENFLSNRKAQLSLANYHRIKFYVAGDPRISVGDTINFNILDGSPTQAPNDKKMDPFYSGKYLITAVRHMLQPAAYTTVVEIVKDSTPQPYNPADNTSVGIQTVIAGQK